MYTYCICRITNHKRYCGHYSPDKQITTKNKQLPIIISNHKREGSHHSPANQIICDVIEYISQSAQRYQKKKKITSYIEYIKSQITRGKVAIMALANQIT